MGKYTKGNTYTPLKHKVSDIMGGITVKLIPYSSGNVENGIKRENRQNDENYYSF